MHDVIRKFGKRDTKFYDVTYTKQLLLASSSMDLNPSTIDCLSAPAQGDTINNRNGHVIYVKSIEISGYFFMGPQESFTDPHPAALASIYVVLDRQTNGTKKTGQSVLSVYNDFQAPLAFPNVFYEDEFEVLARRQVVLQPQFVNEGAANLFASNALMVPFYIKHTFPGLERFIFNGDSAEGIASVVDNSIQVFGCTDDITNAPTLLFNSRLTFYG
jgi:hypothetical protein